MAQEFLDCYDVRAVLQQMRCKRMAHRVRGYMLSESAKLCESVKITHAWRWLNRVLRRLKNSASSALRGRTPRYWRIAAAAASLIKTIRCLFALADNAHQAALKVHVAKVQADQFRTPDAACVQDFHDGNVTQTLRVRLSGYRRPQ